MKLQYKGTSAVDIASHDGVEPGDVIKVDDELGEALLLAGASFPESTFDDDGNVVIGEATLPEHPLWVRTSKKLTHDDGDDDPPDEAPGNPPPSLVDLAAAAAADAPATKRRRSTTTTHPTTQES